MSRQLVVIGGGAAGIFCAVNAAAMNPGLRVTILEKSNKLLSKVKISGGGRCNVTHACFDIPEMSRKYPRGGNFVKKTFHRFFTTDTIKWFAERNVILKEEPDGRMFPVTDSSQTIIDCLMKEVNRLGINILMRSQVVDILKENEKFEISLSDSRALDADFVCVACGGYPKPEMFGWLKNTGHTFEDPVPSLFTFNVPGHSINKLMGISVDRARIRIADSKLEEEGPLLITHWGFSGPAILKLSAWGARQLETKKWQFRIFINWTPDFNEQSLREKINSFRSTHPSLKIVNRNAFSLPQRLWEVFLQESMIDLNLRWADLPAKEQNRLTRNLVAGEFTVNGKTTFKEEFVTAGGVKLSEVDTNTMMSKKIPNLFFAGEILDVDGITGGFNFQHAWTSGFIAAKAIAAIQ